MVHIKQLAKKLLKSEKDIRRNFVRVVYAGALIASFISLIISLLMKYPVASSILILFVLIISAISLIVSYKSKYPTFGTVFMCIATNNILFPMLFIYSGGFRSGMPIWIVFSLCFPLFMLRGKLSIIVFALNTLGAHVSFVVGYLHPDKIRPISTDLGVTVDIASSAILVSLMFGLIFKYHSYIYERQSKLVTEAMDKAEKANKAKTEFLSSISHDIRTPVNSIVGFTEIAKRNIDDRKRVIDCFSKISISSSHLLNLINDFLDMARIESGKVEIDEQVCNVRKLVSDVCHILQPEFEQKDLELLVDMSKIVDETVYCDILRLNQILLNLLNNSIKYSRPGKSVYLTVEQLESTDETKLPFEFRIRDEGFGMSEDVLEKIFLPFERERVYGEEQGTGLGLTITKKLVEMLGGSIGVTSELGRGSEFTVKISFEIPSLTEILDENISKEFDFSEKRILLVEDDPLNREFTLDLLKESGFNVEAARDGSFAIEMVSVSDPGYYDLILMDVKMPLMNGFEATKIIRNLKNEQLRNIPIIALSANAFGEDKRNALESGMNGYLTKPLNISDLLKVMHLILQEQHAEHRRRNDYF